MKEIRIHFRSCQVHYFPEDGYLETRFPDGLVCPALFTRNYEDWERCNSMGYRSPREMHFDHELSHTFLAEAEALDYSPVLHSVARAKAGQEAHCPGAWEEEARVMAFQRYLNTRDASIDLVNYGTSLPEMREEFIARFRGFRI